MGLVTFPYRSYVTVSRGQIARNYRNVCSVVGPAVDVAAVVKADAYGHGALEVSRVLIAEGVRWLAVSSVEEGVALRRGGIDAPSILIMGGFLSYESEAIVEYKLTPVLHSLDRIRKMDELARRMGRKLSYHLKIDSGMGRLGTLAGAPAILETLRETSRGSPGRSDDAFRVGRRLHHSQTENQLAYFHALTDRLREGGVVAARVHTSSSSAIGFGRTTGWHDMVRAGHALYGYVSPARGEAPPQRLAVQPALEWKAKILAVKDIPEGAAVGYGGTFRAPRAMRIGILSAGYADGVFHRLSNRGKVIAAGKLASILGAISMDLTTIDLSDADALTPGDDVTLFGREGDAVLDAQQIARVAGTISYNILCSIGAR